MGTLITTDLEADVFLALPMIVEVASSHERRAYGPFETGYDAQDWCDRQYKEGFTGTFSFVPLRNPDRQRTYSDWWTPDRFQPEGHLAEEFCIAPGQTIN